MHEAPGHDDKNVVPIARASLDRYAFYSHNRLCSLMVVWSQLHHSAAQESWGEMLLEGVPQGEPPANQPTLAAISLEKAEWAMLDARQ